MWDLTTALDLAAKGEPGTKWSKVLDESLVIGQHIKQLHACYENPRFITVLIRAPKFVLFVLYFWDALELVGPPNFQG
jgi:hypothetical protein